MRQAVEPLRPRPQGAGRGAREVGHGRQGRRRDAGGVERRRCLQLGRGRWAAGPGSGGREPDRADEGFGERSCDGFGGSLERRVRRLGPGNDIPRAAAKVMKAGSSGPATNGEKALVISEPRATTDRKSRARRFLEDIEELL